MGKLTYLLILFLCTSAYVVTDIFLPALPAMALDFQVSENMTQLTIAIYTITLGLSQLVYGSLSDRFGRRHLILVGLFIGSIGLLIAVLAQSMTVFLFSRFIQGLGFAAPTVLARSVISDLYKGNQLARANAMVAMLLPLVLTVSPLIGGYVHVYFGWKMIFEILLGYISVLFIISYFFVPETNLSLDAKATQLKVVVGNYKSLLSDRYFVGFTVCSALSSAGMLLYLTEAPFLLQNIVGLSPVEFSWTSVILSVAIMGGGFLTRKFVTRSGYSKLMVYGAYILILAGCYEGLCYYLMPDAILWPLLTGMMIFLIGNTLVIPNATAGAITHLSSNIGLANALYASYRLLFGGMVSLGITYFTVHSVRPFMTYFLLSGALILVLSYFFLKIPFPQLFKARPDFN